MSKSICVYCASSDAVPIAYLEAAESVGRLLAERGHRLVYGGGNVGLMGALAKAVHAGRGHTIAVIPQSLHDRGLTFEHANEIVITRNMRERKETMEHRADAFLVLPGGFGTLEEFFEVLTLRQLGYHNKAIVLLDVNGFFAPLMEMFDHLVTLRFVKDVHRSLYCVTQSAEEALDFIEEYQPRPTESKFF